MGLLEHKGYKREEQLALGSKFSISNGYFGYRGTLDEADSSDFVALNLNGLFDGETIKESINTYNPLYTMIKADGINLNPRSFRAKYHEVSLETENGVFRRHTDFKYNKSTLSIKSERFVDQRNKNLIYSKYLFKSSNTIEIELFSGIDTFVWNIGENHLSQPRLRKTKNTCIASGRTKHHRDKIVVGLLEERSFNDEDVSDNDCVREYHMTLQADKVYTIYKYAGVIHSDDNGADKLEKRLIAAQKAGYKKLFADNTEFWEKAYEISRVQIFNNDKVKEQIDYAVYQLISNRPYSDKVSISKSGQSGQFHMGSVSWRTEILLLPFFINTDPYSARLMVQYRINGLAEAKRKAKQFGYEGAFYPNESGINGYELNQYNMKNNIHINASIIYGVYQYIERTADYSILFQGGLSMLMECARFYLSYAKLSSNKKHYDFLYVRGLDDTHEQVDNEAYTNAMIKNSLDALIKCVAFAKTTDKAEVKSIFEKHNYGELVDNIRELRRKLYTKKENIENLIESFDDYFDLEDVNVSKHKKINFLDKTKLKDLKNTSYVKNSNVLILQALFLEEYSSLVNKSNYNYYMRRSINPEYLARIMYIICACENGYPEDGYKMFQRIANLDLTNEYLFKDGLNLGLLGGIYLAIIYGFAGLKHDMYLVSADYNSSSKIRRIEFRVKVVDSVANVKIKRNSVSVNWGNVDEINETQSN
ncbi:hypothetical protein RJI07_01880 [Mycoplasmatota bacterium WC30]